MQLFDAARGRTYRLNKPGWKNQTILFYDELTSALFVCTSILHVRLQLRIFIPSLFTASSAQFNLL